MVSFKHVVVYLMHACLLAAAGDGFAQAQEYPQAAGARNAPIEAALEKLEDGVVPEYKIGWFDLDGDGKQEAIVLMTGTTWCGTGGCTLMVLKQHTRSWQVVSRIPTSRAPVVLLAAKTHGWRDLAVVVQGGGNLSQRMAVLRFQKGGYVKHHEIAVQNGYRKIIP